RRGRRSELAVPSTEQHAAVAVEAVGVGIRPGLEPSRLRPGAAGGGVSAETQEVHATRGCAAPSRAGPVGSEVPAAYDLCAADTGGDQCGPRRRIEQTLGTPSVSEDCGRGKDDTYRAALSALQYRFRHAGE